MNVLAPYKAAADIKRSRSAALPVIEIFGPTLQGEGPDMGRPAYFVRFGGCDFRCAWCDSMHAVDPATVRATAEHLEPAEIRSAIGALQAGPDLVVLSGGNPALLELAPLVDLLHQEGLEIAVETQGSRWKPWLAQVERLVVSPKGPSSGMDNETNRRALMSFLQRAEDENAKPVLKAVIFDEADLEHARWLALTWPALTLHLSTGTEVGLSDQDTLSHLLGRLRWLSETVARDRVLRRAQVGTQQHVLAWGTRRGV
jgi:7-carboxy-7-deazaguanine synthase